MPQDIPIAEARQILSQLPDRLGSDPDTGAVSISRRSNPVLAVMSWELYESIIETLEILGDEELTESLSKGIKQMDAGKGVDWEDAKNRLEP